jgi:hypothetical protein
MSEDRTIPMKKQPSKGEAEDEQQTILSGQEKPMPPTTPYTPQEAWQPQRDAPFVRSGPAQGITPPSFQAQQRPFSPAAAEDQTMIIAERPKPVFAWLVVVDGPDKNAIGTVLTLQPDTTIGRVSGNQIVLRDETVSSQHARIRREGKEGQEPAFVIFDMGSANGIFAGGRETYKNDESRVYRYELKDGDYLLMGQTTLVFKKL